MLSNFSSIISECRKSSFTDYIKGRTWMREAHWKNLMDNIIPALILDIETSLEQYKILGPILWDLIQQSISSSESQVQILNLNLVLKLLIRNLSPTSSLRERCSQNLITALYQQRAAHKLRPRISSIDPSLLTSAFEGDGNVRLNGIAKFEVRLLC